MVITLGMVCKPRKTMYIHYNKSYVTIKPADVTKMYCIYTYNSAGMPELGILHLDYCYFVKY